MSKHIAGLRPRQIKRIKDAGKWAWKMFTLPYPLDKLRIRGWVS